jgi:hypothetical protein
MRSFKKQRMEYATSVHYDRQQQQQQQQQQQRQQQQQQQQQITCALRPLLQQLTLDNPLAAAPLVENIIAMLQTHAKLMDPESCARLHGMLLLRLGFVMSSASKNNDNPTTTHSTLVFLLLQCLQALYQHLKNSCSLFQSLDSEDLQESFGLVLQIVSGYCLHVENDCCDDTISTTALRQRIIMACWKVLDTLIPSTIGTLIEEHRSLQELLTKLLWSISASTNDNNEPAGKFLKSLLLYAPADLDCKVHQHWASIASMALADDTGMLRTINLPSMIASPQSKVFYWNCILSCANATKSQVSTEIDEVLKELSKLTTSCGMSNAAVMECLCRLAQQSTSLSQDSSRLVSSALVTTLLENQWNLASMDRRQALSCVLSLVERDDEGIQAVLQIERLESFLDLCAKAALKDDDKYTSISASKLFTCIASSMVKEQRKDTTKIFFIMSRVTALLSSEVDDIVQNAVDLIHQILKGPKMQRSVIEEYPDLITELAQVATNDFASHATRHKVMQAFHQVVHTADAFLGEFARYPKVLEAIVQAASQHTSIASNQAEMRNVALSLVLRLSSNVCNRRILAKQPGLLPSLIRYTRSVPGDEREDETLLSREETKKQILVLATAL